MNLIEHIIADLGRNGIWTNILRWVVNKYLRRTIPFCDPGIGHIDGKVVVISFTLTLIMSSIVTQWGQDYLGHYISRLLNIEILQLQSCMGLHCIHTSKGYTCKSSCNVTVRVKGDYCIWRKNQTELTMFVNKVSFVWTEAITASGTKIRYNNYLLTVFVNKLHFVWTMIIISNVHTLNSNRVLTLPVTCWTSFP